MQKFLTNASKKKKKIITLRNNNNKKKKKKVNRVSKANSLGVFWKN